MIKVMIFVSDVREKVTGLLIVLKKEINAAKMRQYNQTANAKTAVSGVIRVKIVSVLVTFHLAT